MPETIHVTAVETTTVAGAPWWLVHQRLADGSNHTHAFPPEALALRAIEYSIDPADTDALLDLILHEPHMAPVPAGVDTFSTATRAARLREAKKAVAITSGGGGQADPLDQIRQRPVGPDVQRIHQALKAHTNRTVREGR